MHIWSCHGGGGDVLAGILGSVWGRTESFCCGNYSECGTGWLCIIFNWPTEVRQVWVSKIFCKLIRFGQNLSHDLQLTTWTMNYAGDMDASSSPIPNPNPHPQSIFAMSPSKVCMRRVPRIELPLMRENCSWCLANILPPEIWDWLWKAVWVFSSSSNRRKSL